MIGFFRGNQNRICVLAIIIFLSILALLALNRKILNYGDETDFVWTYVPEAEHFLNGEPLEMQYHPPLYPITLALFYLIFRNWMIAGIIISLVSASAVMIASYKFVKIVFGEKEAIGSIFALFFSWAFITYSIQATNDLFFTAFFYCSLLFVAIVDKKQYAYLWIISGIFIGLTLLSRTQGVVMFVFLLFPFVSKVKHISKQRIILLILSGIAAPLILWLIISRVTGSPIYVRSSYVNLAASYYSESSDRSSMDAAYDASQEFSNIWQVLAKDPKHLIFEYGKDLLRNTKNMFTDDSLLPFPLILFALPGLILLFLFKFGRFKLVLLLILISMFLLLSLHVWIDRFFIYMVPIFGAGIAAFINHFFVIYKIKMRPLILFFLIFISSLFFLTKAIPGLDDIYKIKVASDALAASRVLNKIERNEDSLIILRHPHLCYYFKSRSHFFPNVKTIEELRDSIRDIIILYPANTHVYLFYGWSEHVRRPQFSMLMSPEFCVDWLKKVGRGNENIGWILHRVLKDQI